MSAEQTLLQAIQSGNLDSVKAILHKFPERVNDQTEDGVPFTLLAAYHQKMDIFHYLIEQKKALSFIEKIAAGKLELVKEVLASSREPLHIFSPDGFTPLTIAAYFGREEIAQYLIERGADVNLAARNHMQVAPLHSAVAIQNINLAKLFLEKGAEVNKSQVDGIRPLHSAVHRGQIEMVELLLKHGADPDLATDDGRTSFDIAEAEGKEELKKMLEA